MVHLNDWIDQGGKSFVGLLTSKVNSYSGLNVFYSRVDHMIKGKSKAITLVLKLVPDLLGEGLREK